jgi:hypothetical protein
MSTPPIRGLIAFRIRAILIRSWPTIAVNGKIEGISSSLSRNNY